MCVHALGQAGVGHAHYQICLASGGECPDEYVRWPMEERVPIGMSPRVKAPFPFKKSAYPGTLKDCIKGAPNPDGSKSMGQRSGFKI